MDNFCLFQIFIVKMYDKRNREINEANTWSLTWYVLKTDVDVIWVLCDPIVADQIGVFQIPQFLKNLSNIKVWLIITDLKWQHRK